MPDMGRLVLEQRHENGRGMALFGGIATGFLVVWAVVARDASALPVAGVFAAATAVGVWLGLSGHRIYENGVELFAVGRATAVPCRDVSRGSAQPIRLNFHGFHTRTTYRIALTTSSGRTVRFNHIAPAGREEPIETFLRRCRVVPADAIERRVRLRQPGG